MTIYEMFVQMWTIDFEMGLAPFDKAYFSNLVKTGQLQPADYKKIVGEDYVATSDQTANTAQA